MTEELMNQLCAILLQAGWIVAVPHCNDDDPVPGLIIGEESYVEAIVNCLPDNLQFGGDSSSDTDVN